MYEKNKISPMKKFCRRFFLELIFVIMQKNFEEERFLEKITELDKKIDLILTAGQILNENGATNDKIIRVLNRIAIFMKIPSENISLHITKQIIFLEIFDGEKSVVSFRIQPTCMSMGEAVGIAAAYGLKNNIPMNNVAWDLIPENIRSYVSAG